MCVIRYITGKKIQSKVSALEMFGVISGLLVVELKAVGHDKNDSFPSPLGAL